MFLFIFLLNIFVLFLIFLSKNIELPVITNLRISLIKTILSFLCLIFVFTEFLSLFNYLNLTGIVTCWSLSFIIFFSLFFLKYKNNLKKINFSQIYIEKNYKLILFSATILIILPLMFICFYYPPNTADSMIYHLTRIEYWVQNQNIHHYPTIDSRQLFHQPFSEFILLHLRILTGNDFLFNLVQFFLMLCSVLIITLITKLFSLDYRLQILSAILCLAIPMGIAQSTSTQTDYIAAFFLISFIYFFLNLLINKNIKYNLIPNSFWASISLGLGTLTKLTTPIFAVGFCFFFAIFILIKYKFKAIKIALISFLIILFINAPFYLRNYNLTGDPIGDTAISNMMKNETMNMAHLTSNIVRNISLHTTMHVYGYNNFIFRCIKKFHDLIGISVQDKRTTFLGDRFRTFFFMDDGSAGNFLLIIFIFLMFIYFIINFKKFVLRKDKILFFYLLSLIFGFALFCAIFKWQPWHSRLQLPLFLASIPIVSYFFYELFENKKYFVAKIFYYIVLLSFFIFWISFVFHEKRIFFVLFVPVIIFLFFLFKKEFKKYFFVNSVILPIILLSLPYVFFNSLRPLMLNKPVMFLNNREQNYFVALWGTDVYKQHKELIDDLAKFNINKIVFDLRGGTWQYPVISMLKNRFNYIEFSPIKFSEFYKKTRNFKKDFIYKAIISDCDSNTFYAVENIEYYKLFGPNDSNGNLRLIILKEAQKLV